jgi:LysR family transcriptional regulator, hydrogen peroxide-inducible genes activator
MDLLATLPVSLRQLQYIVAVADSGGFRRAAEACHVAQPSLSAQIAQAEAALGVQLFERDRRKVRVSAAGAPLVEQARQILIAARDLRELARRLADPYRGSLRVGVIPTVCPYLLPEVTPSLSRAFPDLTIVWSEERTQQLVRQVREGSLDGAILALEADIGDLEHAELGRDAFVLAAAPAHPIVQSRKPATPDALRGATVLLLEDGHCFRDQALGLCGGAGAREVGFRATSLSTLVQMVSASSGVTLLPSLALPVENRRGQLRVRAFARPGPGRTLALAWRRGSSVRTALEHIARTIRDALSGRGGSSAFAELRPDSPEPRRRRSDPPGIHSRHQKSTVRT